VSYNKIGDMLAMQSNLPETVKSSATGSRLPRRLANADPGNAAWQSRDGDPFPDLLCLLFAMQTQGVALGESWARPRRSEHPHTLWRLWRITQPCRFS
jgi:hypothetical protein